MQVRIFIGPTVREPDGLAMSSRNAFLDSGERERAPGMRRGLLDAFEAVRGGERISDRARRLVRARMEEAGFMVDYTAVVDGRTMEPVKRIEGVVLIAAAGRLGGTRLIDNIAVRVNGDDVAETLLEFPEWSRYEW
jgi:pantoate--beta-alanine ligase